MSNQSKRKFKEGDTVTDGLFTKTIICVMEAHGHYMTNVGVIPFENEDEWNVIGHRPDKGEKTPKNNDKNHV